MRGNAGKEYKVLKRLCHKGENIAIYSQHGNKKEEWDIWDNKEF